MTDDLYQKPIAGAEFTRYCGGNQQEEDNESCVSLARIPGTSAGYALRDTKPEGTGKELRFSGDELDKFVLGYAVERGLKL